MFKGNYHCCQSLALQGKELIPVSPYSPLVVELRRAYEGWIETFEESPVGGDNVLQTLLSINKWNITDSTTWLCLGIDELSQVGCLVPKPDKL